MRLLKECLSENESRRADDEGEPSRDETAEEEDVVVVVVGLWSRFGAAALALFDASWSLATLVSVASELLGKGKQICFFLYFARRFLNHT